jgi:hypothetical protein
MITISNINYLELNRAYIAVSESLKVGLSPGR